MERAKGAGTSKEGSGRIMQSQRHRLLHVIAAALAAVLTPAALVFADSVEDFYRGRDMDLYIGYSPGGAYDFYARVMAATWAAISPATRRWCRKTWRAPAAFVSPISSIASRCMMVPPSARSGAAFPSTRC